MHFRTPFLLMILVQTYMLINNHIGTWVGKSTEKKLSTFEALYFFQLGHQNSSNTSLSWLKTWFLGTVYAFVDISKVNFTSMSKCLLIILITRYCAFTSRSRRSDIFYKRGVLKNFAKFIGKHLCWKTSFLINCRVEASNTIFIWLRCFSLNIMEFLRTPSIQKNLRETVSAFLFKLFSTYLLIFLAHFWFSTRNRFLVCWFFIHWVISAICFWQYVFEENWYSLLSWF